MTISRLRSSSAVGHSMISSIVRPQPEQTSLASRRQTPMQAGPKTDEVAQYLVVTLIVATGYTGFTAYPTPSFKDMEAMLQRLGTLLTSDLLGLEVIWSPENPDDALTEDELVAEYPELSAL